MISVKEIQVAFRHLKYMNHINCYVKIYLCYCILIYFNLVVTDVHTNHSKKF